MTDIRCSSGSAPVVKSFTGSTKNDRCLEVWFAAEVTDETRAWPLEAINEKALRGAAQAAQQPDGWQWRQSLGSDWSEWFCLNIPIEKFREEEKHGFEDGIYEARPLYAVTPSPGAGEDWSERLAERVMQLQAAGAETLTCAQVLGLIAFVRDGEGSAVTSTTCAGAATKHSGTFLGYRDEHGNEMHCAHAFCPHQAKCHKGCINPVAMTSAERGAGK